MNKILHFTGITICLFFLPFLPKGLAQFQVIAPNFQTLNGEEVLVDIKVVNFTDMVTGQFTIQYDTSVLQFIQVPNAFAFPYMDQNNFGTPGEVAKGNVTFLWVAEDIVFGEDLLDSTTWFSIRFLATGDNGQVSPIDFADAPTMIEFGDINGVVNNAQLFDGSVQVGVSGSTEVRTAGFTFPPISPNPLVEKSFIRFALLQQAETIIKIYDRSGIVVFQHTRTLGSGPQSVEIRRSDLPAPGTYFVQLAVPGSSGVQKLVVVD